LTSSIWMDLTYPRSLTRQSA